MSRFFETIWDTSYALLFIRMLQFSIRLFPKRIKSFGDLHCKSVMLEFLTTLKFSCHAFFIHPNGTIERHVTHTRSMIIVSGSNHVFCPKTRLQKWSFLVNISRVVYAPKLNVSKISLLRDRGYPPSFQKTRNPTVVEDRHFTWWPLYCNPGYNLVRS